MEPQIIDYYNEMPHGINVIAKMDEEYEEAMDKIKQIEEENKQLKEELNKLTKKFEQYDGADCESCCKFTRYKDSIIRRVIGKPFHSALFCEECFSLFDDEELGIEGMEHLYGDAITPP